MPAMKVTPDAAMRARDVSRPRAEQLRWAEEAEASAAAGIDVVAEAGVVIEAGVTAEPGVATEVGHRAARAERPGMAATPAEVDIPDLESPDSEDRPADARQVDGTRRRRVRGFRSSSRRGRPSR